MFIPNRTAGLHQLNEFLPHAAKAYAMSRNSDYGEGNHHNVSTLSPWLRHRLVSEEEVIRKVLRAHSFSSAEKFLQEVFWRSYFKGWLQSRPTVWKSYCDQLQHLHNELQKDQQQKRSYLDAVNGKTGIECFDSWTRELIETGYLHNHARMWFASIWIFTLRLPWELGAQFFMHHLLDGDPASNTCSWRWVGGLHTKGKHYVARASNIEKFTQGRFNPQGQLNEDPLPLTEDTVHPLVALPQNDEATGNDYVLLVTEEDCLPETLPLSSRPKAIIGFVGNAARSEISTTFKKQAVQDAVNRATKYYDCPGNFLGEISSADEIRDSINEKMINEAIISYLPMGHMADQLNEMMPALQSENIVVRQLCREYDSVIWPHATKGFFKLKQKIPTFVASLGLD